jgi:hypothetical protein
VMFSSDVSAKVRYAILMSFMRSICLAYDILRDVMVLSIDTWREIYIKELCSRAILYRLLLCALS